MSFMDHQQHQPSISMQQQSLIYQMHLLAAAGANTSQSMQTSMKRPSPPPAQPYQTSSHVPAAAASHHALVPNSFIVPPIRSTVAQATVCTYLHHAQSRWMKAHELQAILLHAKEHQYRWSIPEQPNTSSSTCRSVELLSTNAPSRPKPGSVYLFSKQLVKGWRKDEYEWKNADRHTNLKLHGVDAVACYYSKCSESSSSSAKSGEEFLGQAGSFQRRGYCLLTDPDIVLVHYLDGRKKVGPSVPMKLKQEGMDVAMSVKQEIQSNSSVDISQFIPFFIDVTTIQLMPLSPSPSPPPTATTHITLSTPAANNFASTLQQPAAIDNGNSMQHFSQMNSTALQQQQQHLSLPSLPQSHPPSQSLPQSGAPITVLDYSPTSEYIDGGGKMMVCLSTTTNDTSSPSAATAQYFLHLLRTTPLGLQINVCILSLEPICPGTTYRCILPCIRSGAGENYAFFVSNSPNAPQGDAGEKCSGLCPFTFKTRSVPSNTVGASQPQGSSHPTVIRTRSRETRESKLRRGHDQQWSRSPSASPVPTAGGRRNLTNQQQHPQQQPNDPAAVDTQSHERDFILALMRRLQTLERSVAATSCSAATGGRIASPNYLSPASASAWSPFASLSPPPPTSNGLPAPLATSASLSLTDLESCLLDATGEDLLESILLACLRKVMELDSGSNGAGTANVTPTVPCSPALLQACSIRDEHGRQLIHYVCGLGYTNLLSLLLTSLGADVNSRDGAGRTPLHFAVLVQDPSDELGVSSSSGVNGPMDYTPAALMVSALLSFGADDSLLDNRGFTPLALADAAGRTNVVQVFLDVQNAESLGHDAGDGEEDGEDDVHPHHRTDVVDEDEELTDASSIDEHDTHQAATDDMLMVDSSSHSFAPAPSTAAPSSSSGSGLGSSAASSSHGSQSGSFHLDRAFSSLTLHDMGINASDFVLPSSDGSIRPGGGQGAAASMSVSELFSSPTSHFSRVVSAIQRQIRWWLFRRHMAANKLQSVARGMLARRSMKRMREASLTIQSKFRQVKVRRDFVKLQRATRLIQEKFRRGVSTSTSTNPTTMRSVHGGTDVSGHNSTQDSTAMHDDDDTHGPTQPPHPSRAAPFRRYHEDENQSYVNVAQMNGNYSDASSSLAAQHMDHQQHQQQSLQSPSGLEFQLHSPEAHSGVLSPDPLAQMLQDPTFHPLEFDQMGQLQPLEDAATLQQQADMMMA